MVPHIQLQDLHGEAMINNLLRTRLLQKRSFMVTLLCLIALAISPATPLWAADLPDLTMTSVSGPSSANTEQQITVAYTVKNRGTVNAGYFLVGIYLSTDATITTGDTLVATRSVPNLAAGAESTENTVVTIPSSVASGTYYIGVIADTDNRIAESDETNNVLMGNQITVTKVYPDLTMTVVSVTPTSAETGQQVTLTATAKNQGQGHANYVRIFFYLSADATITKGDTPEGYVDIPTLLAGADSTVSKTISIPVMNSGTYYVHTRSL
jgi:subtilase family serine protease